MIKKQKYIHDFVTGIIVPQIEMNLTSVQVEAGVRPLRVTWTPELAQDLTAYHNIDAEQELTNLLSEHVAAEIDREIIRDLQDARRPDPIRPRTGGLLTSGEVGNIGMEHMRQVQEDTVNRWSELGFLGGLDGHVRENIATLYEGQASALINETDTQTDNGFDTVTFPIVRQVFARTLGHDIVSMVNNPTPTLEEEADEYEVDWRTQDTWVYENLYGSLIGISMEMRPHEFIPKKYVSTLDLVGI